TTQQIKGTTKTDAGACAGLKKQVTQNGTFEHFSTFLPAGVRLHIARDLKDLLNGVAIKLVYREDVFAFKAHSLCSFTLRLTEAGTGCGPAYYMLTQPIKANAALKRFKIGQQNDGQQNQHRKLIEDTIKAWAAPVTVVLKISQ